MQLQTWKIQGRGAFHFGEHGIEQEESRLTWPSDSLFAAIIARLASLHGDTAVQAWLGTPQQPRTPPFLLTSTFPFAGDVRFFPVPKAALRPTTSLPPSLRVKDLKKVRFVSEGIYRRLLDGASLAEIQPVRSLHDKTVWMLKNETLALPKSGGVPLENRHFWQFHKRPRVAVGRTDNISNLFHVGEVRFAPGCGLWFGVQWLTDDAQARALLADLLTDLGDAGLGAERASGYGQAAIQEDAPLTLPDPDTPYWTTLSRYLPANKEEAQALTTKGAAYEIERLGGWIDGSPLRRIPLHLLREGAVLGRLAKQPPYGRIVDVRPTPRQDETFAPPPHPVWRNGLAVAVGYHGGAA